MTDFSKRGPNPETTCGYGHGKDCCCTCAYRLLDKPKCHHLGGVGACGEETPKFPKGPLGALAKAEWEDQKLDKLEETPGGFACTAFSNEGIIMSDWDPHGICVNHDRMKSRDRCLSVSPIESKRRIV